MTYDQDYDETAILSEAAKVVYVRAVKAADLPEDVREQVPGVKQLFAVHDSYKLNEKVPGSFKRMQRNLMTAIHFLHFYN